MSDNTPMTLERAIQTAIEYETNVRDLYQDAAGKATEEVGKKIFAVLAKEEQGHLDYLMFRFDEWERTGTIESPALATLLPSREQIAAGLEKLGKTIETKDWSVELDLLRKALHAESTTGEFYKQMVAELDTAGQKLFRPFMEIEDAHYDLVQAQIDALNGMGFWFDFMEFDLEAG
jgi:rubrerythrin